MNFGYFIAINLYKLKKYFKKVLLYYYESFGVILEYFCTTVES